MANWLIAENEYTGKQGNTSPFTLVLKILLSVFVVVLHMIQKLLEDTVCIHGLADSEGALDIVG